MSEDSGSEWDFKRNEKKKASMGGRGKGKVREDTVDLHLKIDLVQSQIEVLKTEMMMKAPVGTTMKTLKRRKKGLEKNLRTLCERENKAKGKMGEKLEKKKKKKSKIPELFGELEEEDTETLLTSQQKSTINKSERALTSSPFSSVGANDSPPYPPQSSSSLSPVYSPETGLPCCPDNPLLEADWKSEPTTPPPAPATRFPSLPDFSTPPRKVILTSPSSTKLPGVKKLNRVIKLIPSSPFKAIKRKTNPLPFLMDIQVNIDLVSERAKHPPPRGILGDYPLDFIGEEKGLAR